MREYMMDPGEFAKLIDVNLKTYYGWENGTTGPSLKKSLEIAKKLSKKVEEIWYLE
ncbi:helix-turn-helix domain-containing protein [Clostridiaceae bacterium UIB06]|nr:helix-turn-helix domain-containing protein [Clostridiaceae bacterium UIB06]